MNSLPVTPRHTIDKYTELEVMDDDTQEQTTLSGYLCQS